MTEAAGTNDVPHAERLARLEAENRSLQAALSQARRAAGDSQGSPGEAGDNALTAAAELERLNGQVDALRGQLAHTQRLASLGTMTAMVAHEFNNILTPIINYAQLARKNPALVDKALARAAETGRQASDICQAILGLTRNSPSAVDELDLADLLGETVLAIGRRPERDGIELTVSAPDGATVSACKVRLQHVLLNLLLNARNAVLKTDRSRRIDLSAEVDDHDVIFRVGDNGVGIDPEHLERIFEPFFTTCCDQGDRNCGHGLGLAVCREIARAMGGDITVESTPGEGATFTFSVPVRS